jgi:hypothetical protein
MIALRRIAAGVYETHDGQHRIVRTEGWEGPRGGEYVLWEHAKPDPWSSWVIDALITETTLRAARAELARHLRSGPVETVAAGLSAPGSASTSGEKQ